LLSSKSPPAWHAAAAEQDTASRLAKDAPAGFGVVWAAQDVPFHVAAAVMVLPWLLLKLPTASQDIAVAHERAVRKAVLGVVCALHADPFQLAAPPEPIASQKVRETHETALTPDSAGTVCSCHDVPFQFIANGPVSREFPAASQNFAEMQEIPRILTLAAPTGFGVDCRCHVAPFHRAVKASVSPTPLL